VDNTKYNAKRAGRHYPGIRDLRLAGIVKLGPELRKIEQLYDSIAVPYSVQFAGEHEKKPMDRDLLGRFAREIGEREPVWDLGCGPGETTGYLCGLGIKASGLDLSGRILEQARVNKPGIHFRRGNILALDFESGSIAGITAFYAIVHFTKNQVATAFKEIFRVLQPEGALLLTYHVGDETIHINEFLGTKVDIDFMLFTSGVISEYLVDAGFGNVEILEREPYPRIEYESRRGYAFAIKPGGVSGGTER
jgi:SAM-dependent methyltransferase